jgi:hypothetical protein
LKWEYDGDLYEVCDHITSIRFLGDQSRGKAPSYEMTIESGDQWSNREGEHDVHLLVATSGLKTLTIMPEGIVCSTGSRESHPSPSSKA